MNCGTGLDQGKEEVGNCSSSSPAKDISVMRKFLESGMDFTWPGHLGECYGNHCDLRPDECIPLKWIRKISDKTKASIDKYEAPPGFAFREAFVVKTIRETNSQKARSMTANEVNNMRDLRHPHISALLGTFEHQERLSILIFPAARCDLHQYMKQLSKDLQEICDQSHPSNTLHRVVSQSSGTSTQDSTTSHSRNPHGPEIHTSKQKAIENRDSKTEAWPLMLSVDRRMEILRGFFVCLSQALSYLHESGVRHKDIKPKNILIDESGSVILTDFGISRRFPKDKPHVTNDKWNFTRKYASPEMMKGKRMLRDDPSDVFSLGCVFLEIATLLLGENLTSLSKHCTTTVNVSAKEKAYYCNLDKVYLWIDHLRASNGFKLVQDSWRPSAISRAKDLISSPENRMVGALVDVRRMLDEVPSNRPLSKYLWQQFQEIGSERCKDCDPRRPEDMWEPSIRQQSNAKTGLINRRSMHVEDDPDIDAREPFRYGRIDSTLLSAHNLLTRSDQRRPRGSSPSTSLRSFTRRDHPKAMSRPKSPISQRPIERPGSAGRNGRSTSPRLHISETSVEMMSGEEVPIPSQIIPASIIETAALDYPAQSLSNIEAIPLGPRSQNSGLRAAKGDPGLPSASYPTTTSQTLQLRANSHEKTNYRESVATITKETIPTPQTPIIVYDVSQSIVFVTVFASLKGVFSPLPESPLSLSDVILNVSDLDYISCPLPKTGQQVEIGERPILIAKVSLGPLGWGTRIRRWKGDFPRIYVRNYAATPLQPD